jgi:hypothetical protein
MRLLIPFILFYYKFIFMETAAGGWRLAAGFRCMATSVFQSTVKEIDGGVFNKHVTPLVSSRFNLYSSFSISGE